MTEFRKQRNAFRRQGLRPLVAEGRAIFNDAIFVWPDAASPQNNSLSIIGAVQNVLHVTGATKREIERFVDEATSHDREHLEFTVLRWVRCLRRSGELEFIDPDEAPNRKTGLPWE